MTVLDLTHLITETMPVYPGTQPPSLTPANTIERDGFAETILRLYSHTGTHMDAPAHIEAGLSTLDSLAVDNFVGKGVVIDCSGLNAGALIKPEHLTRLKGAEYILFYTGWDRYWGLPSYYGAFPVPAPETLELLIQQGIKGVGIDALSVDPISSAYLPNHRLLFTSGLVIVENLTGLSSLVGRSFTFCALPLKYQKADGAPVRAVALL